jgi:RNA polymerase sigma-70 factor, ECF subfamily
MNEKDRHRLFSELIASCHSELFAYIFAIVRNRDDAGDIFQSVCLILWRKFDSFQPGSSFSSWARQTAKFTARSFLRHKVKGANCVGEELLDSLTETDSEDSYKGTGLYLAALSNCRGKLNADDAELLELRYMEGLNSREIANRLQRPQTSICRSLNRVRNSLLECIEMELNRCEHSGGHLS